MSSEKRLSQAELLGKRTVCEKSILKWSRKLYLTVFKIVFKEICDTLDLIHLMTYDFHGGWEDVIDHHAAFVSDGKNRYDPDSVLTVKVILCCI